MSWQTQQNDRPPESAHAVAWAALFFSLIACAMSGYVLIKGQDTDKIAKKLKENLKTVGEEASKLINKKEGEGAKGESAKPGTGKDGAKESSRESGKESAEKSADEKKSPLADVKGEVKWDKLQDKLDNLRTMLGKGDDRASSYLESIKRDLVALRDYATDKSSDAINGTMSKLEEVKDKLKTDHGGAMEKLRQMSDEIAPKVRSLMGKNSDEKLEEAQAKPEESEAKPTAPPEKKAE